jgi:hypothetical protein
MWWLKVKRGLSGSGGLPSVWNRRVQGLLDRESRFLSSQTQVPRQSYVVTWGQNEVYPVNRGR